MSPHEMKQRTKRFALDVIRLADSIPASLAGKIIAGQIIRSGTSVGANYRSSCRARSRADFISKIGVVEEEADETAFWLELLADGNIVKSKAVEPLRTEAEELTRMMHASRKTAFQGKDKY